MSLSIKNNYGVVYGASGGVRHIKEAIQSAQSIKRFHPDISSTLFTDHWPPAVLNSKGCDLSVFGGGIKRVKDKHARNKFDAMLGTPYERTLYLDNDTVVRKPVIEDMFRVLDSFDMAITHAPLVRIVTPLRGLPDCFTEFNGGVILYKSNERVMSLLRAWEQNWKNKTIDTKKGHKDQPYFRKLIWESDLRIYILPPEYNVRKKDGKKIFIHHRRGVSL